MSSIEKDKLKIPGRKLAAIAFSVEHDVTEKGKVVHGSLPDRRLTEGWTDILDAQKLFGKHVKDAIGFHNLIEHGFPYSSVEHIKKMLDLSDRELAVMLDISERTLARVKKSRDRLSAGVSDRLYRIARIFSMACYVFEDKTAAKKWLRSAQIGLGGNVPLDLMHTEAGAQEVEDLLGRIEYGVIS